MPFVFVDIEQIDDAALQVHCARWENGALTKVLSTRLSSEPPVDADASSADATQHPVVDLLSIVSHATVAGPATVELMSALDEVCREAGYERTTAHPDLFPFALVHEILSPITVPPVFAEDSPWATLSLPESLGETARQFSDLFQKALVLPFGTLQHLAGLGNMVTPALGGWFEEVAEQRMKLHGSALPETCDSILQLSFRSVTEPDSIDTADGSGDSSPESWGHPEQLLQDDSPIAGRLQGFQARPGQLEMVQAVHDALENGKHLLVEAGTGTGKSLAYLIPAILYAKEHDDRVVVSTHTISLQDQIEHRDFPLLREVFGEDVSLRVLKGRTHYVCMRKLHQELQSVTLMSQPEEILTYMGLVVWLTQTETGSREELPSRGMTASMWPRIQSETETCIHKRCPFFRPCYYFRARSAAYNADVVVTNHSLVFTDLKAEHRVLPRYSRLVFDEAHHVEQEATKHLGQEVVRFQLLGLIGRLYRDNGKHGVLGELVSRLSTELTNSARILPKLQETAEHLSVVRSLADETFLSLARLIPRGQSDLRITESVQQQAEFSTLAQNTEPLERSLAILVEAAEMLSEYAEQETDETLSGRMFDAAGFLHDLCSRTRLLVLVGSAPADWVEWIERSGAADRPNIALRWAPIDVSSILRERLFETKDSIVLTSATLSVAGNFQYIARKLGFPAEETSATAEGARQLSVASPFRMDKQALLCVPNDIPDLSKMSAGEAAVWLSDSIYQLARVSGGRLLALFTSHQMLRATADYLRDPLEKADLQLYAQGIDGNRTQLLRRFQNHPRSVLLGAQSFWEGIDLPGDQLTTLVIVRLPFTPPTHPVTQARSERLEAAGVSAFWHLSLPEAVVRFRQGLGRLIRTVHDRGVVVVFDKRIVTARYGRQFLQSVPGLQVYVEKEHDLLKRVKTFLS